MALKLMYITNNSQVAKIAENSGIDRIFVDLEYIGKELRQGGMDTVQNHHTANDIKNIKSVLSKAEIVARINPIHDKTDSFISTEEEVDLVINNGADIVMLPYFKTADEVKRFITAVSGRAKTMLLFESKEAVENIDEILNVEGIDEVYIGLNDLSLSYGLKFLFVPLINGTVEKLIEKFKEKNLPYGFGGIASLGKGDLPSDNIIPEHLRLGSTSVILSRSFCNVEKCKSLDEIARVFKIGVKQIRNYENLCLSKAEEFFKENREIVVEIINQICEE